jgi:hypothetical protein
MEKKRAYLLEQVVYNHYLMLFEVFQVVVLLEVFQLVMMNNLVVVLQPILILVHY